MENIRIKIDVKITSSDREQIARFNNGCGLSVFDKAIKDACVVFQTTDRTCPKFSAKLPDTTFCVSVVFYEFAPILRARIKRNVLKSMLTDFRYDLHHSMERKVFYSLRSSKSLYGEEWL